MKTTQRNFITIASVITAGSVIQIDSFSKARKSVGPNDKIQVGLIEANVMVYTNF